MRTRTLGGAPVPVGEGCGELPVEAIPVPLPKEAPAWPVGLTELATGRR